MSAFVQGRTGDWEIVIGMEVHAQVVSNSKLFSGSSAVFGASPNYHVSLVDAAMPGMLPVINTECIRQAVITGLGLNAQINKYSVFDRKNYFYADLPQGYQISQFKHPIVGEGEVQIELADASTHIIGIERLHLEQDAGKSLHDQHPSKSYIDLNRSGVALMEIVSKPEMHSAEQAAAYIKKLRSILRYLGTCDGNMEEGSLRADVNVSVRKPGEPLGTRTETKNLNSVRFIMQTIDYEVQRQIELIEDGGVVVQETRLFDTTTGMTRTMRGKEDAHDYRYFPDPDLLPLKFDDAFIADLKKDMPELPDQIKSRMVQEYGLSSYDANVLTEEKETAAFYELASDGRDRKLTANWMSVELFGALNKAGLELSSSPVSPMQLGDLVDLISDGSISGKIAKEVFADMFETGKNAKQIVEEKGLKQVSDEGSIITMIDDVMASNQDKVDEYRSGKEKLFGFFVGQVMKASQGQANPGMVNQILKEKLKG
ncbi:Asp-tRNA(Asn)/Glu-tRNA(Gln) amidotransferase subunit GatB [Alphaproteobacteria bacterium]|nr:Asp-tRNA(Asn)/Glu-tRNA(Gln) amidotransferase subunit GatB [Alphaproteobacteria bacterium]MBT5799278.1 Asp-tRNA(Asn)/Glu-tRNA(Gln) amidotransferase subunit GatB [Alphaproteobacteria bacterium]MDA9189945.1 Asp-tRNA(Asn)/Glu-tRNA(Gln) amidotransferase subunit GatB [Alphaproteobacteria bacterium]